MHFIRNGSKEKKKFYLVLLIIFAFVLSSCETSSDVIVPVYLDMEITGQKSDDSEITEIKDNEVLLEEEMIIREAGTLFGDLARTDEHYDFYLKLSELVLITIHVSNPNNLEIDRVVINGQGFDSRKFQEGSDFEKIILEIQLSETGTDNLTFNRLEYISGESLTRVDIEKTKTFFYGIQYEPVTVMSGSYSYWNSSHSFTFEGFISPYDPHNLIEDEEKLKVLLFEGETILQHRNFDGSLSFTELSSGKEYLLAIVAVFDLGDGEGERIHILKKIEFTTEE